MEKLIKKWLNKGVQPTGWEKNTYEPLKIKETIYPNGQKQMSLNGKDEWYGLQEGTIKTRI
jgi:hypothetical protein